jgi:hypothetical protein
MKTQNYSIFHRNKDRKQPWVFRFRETVNDNGTLRTIHRKRILCPATVKPEEAKKLAELEAAKVAQSRPSTPEKIVNLGEYVSRVYLPFAESSLRFWTVKSYRVMWQKHFASSPAHNQKAAL